MSAPRSHLNAYSMAFGASALLFIATFVWSNGTKPAPIQPEPPRSVAPPPPPVHEPAAPMPEPQIRMDGRSPFMPAPDVQPPVKTEEPHQLAQAPVPPQPTKIETAEPLAPVRRGALLRLFGVAEVRGRRICLIETDAAVKCSLDRGAPIPGTSVTVTRIDKQSVQIDSDPAPLAVGSRSSAAVE